MFVYFFQFKILSRFLFIRYKNHFIFKMFIRSILFNNNTSTLSASLKGQPFQAESLT